LIVTASLNRVPAVLTVELHRTTKSLCNGDKAMTVDIVDSDTHYYEPPDCFTRYIEPKFRDSAIKVEDPDSGKERVMWRGQQLHLVNPGFFTEALNPGSLKEMFQAIKKGIAPDDARLLTPIAPEWRDRSARIAKMDELGVDAMTLYPTLGLLWEHHLRHDTEALYANLRAYNRWLSDDWGYARDDRLFAAPMVSLHDPEFAVAELSRVLDEGARVVVMKPGHANHRSPADPIHDQFWAMCQEAEVPVAFHMSESGYNEFYSTDFGENPTPRPHEKSALQWAMFYGDRPIMDTFAACILHNLFGRFPRLRLVSVENGSGWVGYLLSVMDKMKGMGRSGPWLGGRVKGRPSDIFREHIYVSPFPEDDVAALVDLIGEERVLMGSDFPHAEGTATPMDMVKMATGLSPTAQALYLAGNARQLLKTERAAVA
jgi:predicted TIM-barrel fold metal-dependent hydrolase